MLNKTHVVIKGAGDIASGVAYRLFKAGFKIIMTELAEPMAIRRSVSFSEAIYNNKVSIDGITAKSIESEKEIETGWKEGWIPVLVDPEALVIAARKPEVIVDAILAKRNTGTNIRDANLVIGLGPGFTAGVDVHAVVETNRGHYLGRVYWTGSTQPDTGVPGNIAGIGKERVVYSPANGGIKHVKKIGDIVRAGDILAYVGDIEVQSQIDGVLRGLIHDGVCVNMGMKIADVDPRGVIDHCWTISEKALAIGGGVLEAILTRMSEENNGE